MFVNPSSAFVGNPSVVASSSGRAKNARYARLLPSTRKSSESRAGPSSSSSSAPVSVFGTLRVYAPEARLFLTQIRLPHLLVVAEHLGVVGQRNVPRFQDVAAIGGVERHER